MPRLILFNGAPANGKSTLARLYVDDHPLALNLDIDQVRAMLGRWRDDVGTAGLRARARIVEIVDGDPAGTYRRVLVCLSP